ncbi:hypothetical protein P7K49_037706 [Saguinus oedipus]|uniref:Syntaxin 6/10/61 N-terminal domain-containing protein n=1 Tax=Saguinus oedipus TaxID=9490 RepID=A0ABQ9TIX2_SAGOE|nr:hypothetical protein P7K49_037706 [Saguinus oedipus]
MKRAKPNFPQLSISNRNFLIVLKELLSLRFLKEKRSSGPFAVEREVQKAVNTAQGLFQRWTELLQDPSTATREEIDWTTNELRNNLRSIEWDLEDLDETINILFCGVCAIWGK